MHASTMACKPVPDLPFEVIVHILRHVKPVQRLTRCTLVSGSWHKAAAVAASNISRKLNDTSKLQGMLSWLSSSCHRVEQFRLTGSVSLAPLQQLPCARLRDLQLEDCAVKLAAGAGCGGVLQVATGLTKLQLKQCTMLEGPDCFAALAVLTDLMQLVLESLVLPEGSVPGAAASAIQANEFYFPGTVLEQLQHCHASALTCPR